MFSDFNTLSVSFSQQAAITLYVYACINIVFFQRKRLFKLFLLFLLSILNFY